MRPRHNEQQGRQPGLRAIRTHAEVAAELGIVRQRVVQLEQSALKKLRRSRILRELFG